MSPGRAFAHCLWPGGTRRAHAVEAIFMNALAPVNAANRVVGHAVRWIRLNTVSLRYYDRRPVVIKRRNVIGRELVPLANWFFHTAGAPISFWRDPSEWQRREWATFRMLNPGFRAIGVGTCVVCEDRLPGETMWVHAKRGTLTPRMLAAA